MHVCLKIDEITNFICSFLCNGDLLSTALTCKQLEGPALTSLWKELPSLLPFLKLFPGDSMLITQITQKHNRTHHMIVGTRELEPADWLRATRYAPWIRKLRIDHDAAHSPFLQSIALIRGGIHIFPNLQELQFLTPLDSCISFVKVAASPCLTHLTLQSTGSAEAISMLSQLGLMCPSITSFQFSLHAPNAWQACKTSAVRDNLSLAICSWAGLRRLEVPIKLINAGAFKSLSRFTYFSHLCLHWLLCPEEMPMIMNPGLAGPLQSVFPWLTFFPGFDSLRTLEILGCPLSHIAGVLYALEARWLKRIVVRSPHRDLALESSSWTDFFHAVVQRAVGAEELVLDSDCSPPSSTRLESSAVSPLLAARNLVELYIPGCHHLTLTDNFIKGIAEASPKLEILDIGTMSPMHTPTLTLNAYRYIFTCCPRIKHLGLSIDTDASVAEEYKSEDAQLKRHGKGVLLQVGSSIANDPLRIATFLLPFFYEPMGMIGHAPSTSRVVLERWEQVWINLKKLIEETAP